MSVGLIVPSSNPTIEAFLPAVADVLDVQFLVTRIGVRRIAIDADSDAQFDRAGLTAAAALLTDAEVSLVSWAGTSGFWLGVGRESAALAAVSSAVGVPVVSTRIAMMAALDQDPDVPLGLLTPYTDDVHQGVIASLASAGREITADTALGIERNLDFAAIPAEAVVRHLRKLANTGGGLPAVVCTNVLATLPELADEPFVVLDSVLATLWHAAREVGATSMTYTECYRAVLAGQLALNKENR